MIKLGAVECSQAIGVIGIQQKGVQHRAQYGMVALVSLQCLPGASG
jgi:hypothetical protein